ncbi:Radical SAM domain-containing protein [Alicyclobacillus hesperidum URH17-3-68]|uniref:SPL family radical SAM protein n=1 Tax=Alicyclobacillus hesperidum TaxID=89784 RepID=UPI000281B5FC|nr:radical SAM protein [Alicyclobacillus hesperidum]EJY56022.1 Radical SAM domain-containing protein [Alicyclobacillus hesperidum URH17-3-68]
MKPEFKHIVAKRILTEARGYLDVGFTHSLNPYRGCTFACAYCYVREMPIQKFHTVPWGEWVDVKSNAAENYSMEMVKLRRRQKPVHIFMSSATDPYQPIERQAGITRALLEAMLNYPPDVLQIQTRGPLITRDIELLVELKKCCDLLVSVTVETDRDDIRRIFAPFAPGIQARIKVLQQLHESGIATQAAISPVLPFSAEFPKLLSGKVDRIWIDTLSIGDGSFGKRSVRLGMPRLFDEHGLSKWYRPDLHTMVAKHFTKYFPEWMIRVSRSEAFPLAGEGKVKSHRCDVTRGPSHQDMD